MNYEKLIKEFKILSQNNKIPIITSDEKLTTAIFTRELKDNEQRYVSIDDVATSKRLLNNIDIRLPIKSKGCD